MMENENLQKDINLEKETVSIKASENNYEKALIPYKINNNQQKMIERFLDKTEDAQVLEKTQLSSYFDNDFGKPQLSNCDIMEPVDHIEKNILEFKNATCISENNRQEETIVLSARSSTPYTQTQTQTQTLTTNVKSADLVNKSEQVSPAKENHLCEKENNLEIVSKLQSSPLLETSYNQDNVQKSKCQFKLIDYVRYSRDNLLHIRKDMTSDRESKSSNIITCDAIELENRLRRLNLWKTFVDNNSGVNTNYKNLKTQNKDVLFQMLNKPCPSVDSSIIKSQPEQYDIKKSLNISNPRRIGSGRLQNKFVQFSSDQLQNSHSKNFSKLNESSEENRNYHHNYKYAEPEWFSCGPTSRLETIELTGFDDDIHELDKNEKNLKWQQKDNTMKLHGKNSDNFSTNYSKYDSDSNFMNIQDKMKKKSEFQNKKYKQKNHVENHNNNGSSRFLPLFINQKQNLNKSSFNHFNETPSDTLNKFFETTSKFEKQEKSTDIVSVEQLEAKWRHNAFSNNKFVDYDSKINNTTCSDNISEKFLKLFGKIKTNTIKEDKGENNLNNFKQKTYQNKTQNLLNSGNLSYFFFKQQEYYQQQKQQQAAFAANLQIKAVLGRPDAQAILLGLAKGEISIQGLMVQLANPCLPQRNREIITAVLTFTSAQLQQKSFEIFPNSAIVNQLQNLHNLAVLQQSIAVQQQQQYMQSKRNPQLSINSISYEDLQTHANLIMQNAMMKRKLEEQNSVFGIQKILEFNAAATAAATAAVVVKQQQFQNKQQSIEVKQEQNTLMNLIKSQTTEEQKLIQNGISINQQKTPTYIKNTDGIATQLGHLIELPEPLIRYATDIELKQKMEKSIQIIMSFVKFLKEFKWSTPGVLLIGICGTLCFYGGYRGIIKPHIDKRKRNDAEAIANYIFEHEENITR